MYHTFVKDKLPDFMANHFPQKFHTNLTGDKKNQANKEPQNHENY